jgi:hypothetical protein
MPISKSVVVLAAGLSLGLASIAQAAGGGGAVPAVGLPEARVQPVRGPAWAPALELGRAPAWALEPEQAPTAASMVATAPTSERELAQTAAPMATERELAQMAPSTAAGPGLRPRWDRPARCMAMELRLHPKLDRTAASMAATAPARQPELQPAASRTA